METKTELSNKEKAASLITSMETGDQSTIAYINPTNYKQHNLMVADGLEGFGEVLHHAPEGGFKAKVVRSFQDGEYAFTHTIYDFFGPKVGFDVFLFELFNHVSSNLFFIFNIFNLIDDFNDTTYHLIIVPTQFQIFRFFGLHFF